MLKFDYVISLGSNCQVAYQIKRKGLRQFSGPFDWFTTPLESLINILDKDFKDFMIFNRITKIKNKDSYTVFKCNEYNITSYHDIKLNNNFKKEFNEFKNKINRRINRFKDIIKQDKKILFIIKLRNETQKLNSLVRVLEKKNCFNFRIIALVNEIQNLNKLNKKIIVFKNNVRSTYNSKEDFWKGNDLIWDSIIKNYSLKTQINQEL